MLKSGIKVGDDQHPNKRPKPNDSSVISQKKKEDNAGDDAPDRNDTSKVLGKQLMSWTSPPKIDFKRKSQTKLMADA